MRAVFINIWFIYFNFCKAHLGTIHMQILKAIYLRNRAKIRAWCGEERSRIITPSHGTGVEEPGDHFALAHLCARVIKSEPCDIKNTLLEKRIKCSAGVSLSKWMIYLLSNMKIQTSGKQWDLGEQSQARAKSSALKAFVLICEAVINELFSHNGISWVVECARFTTLNIVFQSPTALLKEPV